MSQSHSGNEQQATVEYDDCADSRAWRIYGMECYDSAGVILDGWPCNMCSSAYAQTAPWTSPGSYGGSDARYGYPADEPMAEGPPAPRLSGKVKEGGDEFLNHANGTALLCCHDQRSRCIHSSWLGEWRTQQHYRWSDCDQAATLPHLALDVLLGG